MNREPVRIEADELTSLSPCPAICEKLNNHQEESMAELRATLMRVRQWPMEKTTSFYLTSMKGLNANGRLYESYRAANFNFYDPAWMTRRRGAFLCVDEFYASRSSEARITRRLRTANPPLPRTIQYPEARQLLRDAVNS